MNENLAVISECGKYRYLLRRILNDNIKKKPCLFIMLNPSKADAKINDPTINKCIKFAEREECSELTVINLFAIRSTDPDNLLREKNIIGDKNEIYHEQEFNKHKNGLIICAWGSHRVTSEYKYYIDDLMKKIKLMNSECFCFKINKDGNPKHPLYVSYKAPLIKYSKEIKDE